MELRSIYFAVHILEASCLTADKVPRVCVLAGDDFIQKLISHLAVCFSADPKFLSIFVEFH